MSARKEWRVFWRVIVPDGGSYGHDMVFLETDSEAEARKRYHGLLRKDWPVCLERVERGPLPSGSARSIASIRALNAA
ncbi:MAG: hypothetical protein IT518_08970 [Burkholderiales bacterium]|nr:hypothetical protein [Burkholderiales bacterium]